MVCYEYSHLKKSNNNSSTIDKAATSDLNFFIEDLKNKLDETSFFKDEQRKQHMYRNITNIFTRHDLTRQEIQTLRGIISFLFRNKE